MKKENTQKNDDNNRKKTKNIIICIDRTKKTLGHSRDKHKQN